MRTERECPSCLRLLEFYCDETVCVACVRIRHDQRPTERDIEFLLKAVVRHVMRKFSRSFIGRIVSPKGLFRPWPTK